MNIIAHTFSGSGNTSLIGEVLGQSLADAFSSSFQKTAFNLPAEREAPLQADKDKVYLVGVPVIAGRVPNLLLPYLNSLEGNGALCIPFVTYGNRAFDDALSELSGILKERGFHILAAAAIIGQHTFATALGTGRPDTSDLEKTRSFGKQVAEKIRSGNLQSPEIAGNWPPGPYYVPLDGEGQPINIVRVKPKTTSDCTDCKLCPQICPLGSIDYDDPTKVVGPCMKCGACVIQCPVDAKYFDDPGYLYHKMDLEQTFQARKEPSFFI